MVLMKNEFSYKSDKLNTLKKSNAQVIYFNCSELPERKNNWKNNGERPI